MNSGMTRLNAVEAVQSLEQGSITLLYRPREEKPLRDLGDVQRLLLLLAPHGSPYARLVVIGRKRLPRAPQHDRFWGFVDLVLTPDDMQAALGTQVSSANTRLRQLPAARALREGAYSLDLHNSHAHLRWHMERVPGDPFAPAIDLDKTADYIVTVANPDIAAWGLSEVPDLQEELFDDLELHVSLPSPYPPALQHRFGNRRFTQLDTTDWLDHPGTELVFASAD